MCLSMIQNIYKLTFFYTMYEYTRVDLTENYIKSPENRDFTGAKEVYVSSGHKFSAQLTSTPNDDSHRHP